MAVDCVHLFQPKTKDIEEDEEKWSENNETKDRRNDKICYRQRLPMDMVRHKFSLWKLLKSAGIGKDLMHLSLPLELFEPLGLLQILCERLEYSNLLDEAVNEPDQFRRLGLIAAFAVSGYASTQLRGQGIPFSPLEGETYECIRCDLGWRFLAEQVSHNPGISACYAAGRGWQFHHTSSLGLAFWGKYIQAKPKGTLEITLQNYKECYRWNKLTTTIHSLFTGTRYVDHHGTMKILSSTKLSCTLCFKKFTHEFHGHINDVDGEAVHTVSGKWDKNFYFDDKLIWEAQSLPDHALEQYGFNNFAVTLNQTTRDIRKILPPTDSRLRPDQKLLEEGNVALGKIQKHKLESDQRQRRQLRKYVPKWFNDKTPESSKHKVFCFNNRYWNSQQNGFKDEQFDQLW